MLYVAANKERSRTIREGRQLKIGIKSQAFSVSSLKRLIPAVLKSTILLQIILFSSKTLVFFFEKVYTVLVKLGWIQPLVCKSTT